MLDDRDVELRGEQLKSKKIDVVVTGGIAGIETPKLIRELRRYGAEVRVVMTAAATQFVQPLVFEWASKNKVITDLSGSAEHITNADAVVVAPATLGFISKIAHGYAESAATTLVQSALSRLPIFIAPTMHSSLAENPLYQENLEKVRALKNVLIFESKLEEGKNKMASNESMVAKICHDLSNSALRNIPVVLSLGPTRSYADNLRYFSNRSSGALGIAIAEEFYRRGSAISLIAGPTQVPIPKYLMELSASKRVETIHEMRDAFLGALDSTKARIAIFSAAILDFEIEKKIDAKVSSKNSWAIELKPTQKLIHSVSDKNLLKVGFKLESKISVEALKEIAIDAAKKNDCRFLVANRFEDVSEVSHRAFILNVQKKEFIEAATKSEIARVLADLICEEISKT